MTPNAYQQLAARTECNQAHSYLRLQHLEPRPQATYRYEPEMLERTRLLHSVLGMAGEVGELSSVLLKIVYYGQMMPQQDLKQRFLDELGDVQWFLAQACTILGLKLDDVMTANIAKLRQRFPNKFTNERSAEKDREAEAKAQQEALMRPITSDPDFLPPVMDYELEEEGKAPN